MSLAELRQCSCQFATVESVCLWHWWVPFWCKQRAQVFPACKGYLLFLLAVFVGEFGDLLNFEWQEQKISVFVQVENSSSGRLQLQTWLAAWWGSLRELQLWKLRWRRKEEPLAIIGSLFPSLCCLLWCIDLLPTCSSVIFLKTSLLFGQLGHQNFQKNAKGVKTKPSCHLKRLAFQKSCD